MPYVQIRLFSQSPFNPSRLGAEATRLMAEIMRKRREVTVVEVVMTQGGWFAGGEALVGPAAYVDVKITRGTNNEAEKQRLLAALHAVIERELGPLAAPAYVVIHELPASDWGYDGRAQAARLAGSL